MAFSTSGRKHIAFIRTILMPGKRCGIVGSTLTSPEQRLRPSVFSYSSWRRSPKVIDEMTATETLERLDAREVHFRIPGSIESLQLFLRYLSSSQTADPPKAAL